MSEQLNSLALALPVRPDDHALGPASAAVSLVEYGDFECPSCVQACHTVNMLLSHFGASLRFVFRHFPLREVHPHAELAAEAAEAAGAQGRFWEVHRLLFENPQHLDAASLNRYAEQAGLDLRRFDYEMGHHAYLARVQADIDGGARSGVRGTPTFFVDGLLCDISYGFDKLRKTIDAAIRAGERTRSPQ
jgi:protein-disulfide isomerase